MPYSTLHEQPSAIWERYQNFAKLYVEKNVDLLHLTNPIAFVLTLTNELKKGLSYTSDLSKHFTESALQSNTHNCLTFALLFLACVHEVFGSEASAQLFIENTAGTDTDPKDAHAILCISHDHQQKSNRFFDAIDNVKAGEKPSDVIVLDFSALGIMVNTTHVYFTQNVHHMSPEMAVSHRQMVYKSYLGKKEKLIDESGKKKEKSNEASV